MALLYPVLLVLALDVARRSRFRSGGIGLHWFSFWGLAGFLISFSFITGLSIGLFILPLAAAVLLAAARLSPHIVEATGFLLGIAGTALLVVALSA
jgi:hypothetical protein